MSFRTWWINWKFYHLILKGGGCSILPSIFWDSPRIQPWIGPGLDWTTWRKIFNLRLNVGFSWVHLQIGFIYPSANSSTPWSVKYNVCTMVLIGNMKNFTLKVNVIQILSYFTQKCKNKHKELAPYKLNCSTLQSYLHIIFHSEYQMDKMAIHKLISRTWHISLDMIFVLCLSQTT